MSSQPIEFSPDPANHPRKLTNLHIDLDYAETDRITPAHVRPAYDGLKIDVTNARVLGPR